MFKITIGSSDDIDTDVATTRAVDAALARLNGHPPAAALVLASVEFDHQLMLDLIVDRLGENVPLIGCTTAGQFAEDTGFAEDAITIMLFASDTVRFAAGLGDTRAGLHQAGKDAGEQINEALGGAPSFGLLTPESQGFNHTEVLAGLAESVGETVPFVGGTCGMRADRSGGAQFFGRRVLTGTIPALGLSGEVVFSTGAASGWRPFGELRRVTAAEGCVVHEIDGHNAYDLMVDEFGGYTMAVAAEYPLAVYPDPELDSFYLRAIMDMDAENRVLVFAAEVPVGAAVRLTAITPEDMLTGARASITEAFDHYPGDNPAGVFVVSCVARKWLMGLRASQEHDALKRGTGTLPLAGFYSFGEIGPLGGEGASFFHNETCISLALGEG